MDDYDHEEHLYRVNFINNRLIELKRDRDILVKIMHETYTKTEIFQLKQIKDQIEYHENLIMTLDDGQEEFHLEN